mgnify:CR=1 FL=1
MWVRAVRVLIMFLNFNVRPGESAPQKPHSPGVRTRTALLLYLVVGAGLCCSVGGARTPHAAQRRRAGLADAALGLACTRYVWRA